MLSKGKISQNLCTFVNAIFKLEFINLRDYTIVEITDVQTSLRDFRKYHFIS